MNNRMNDRLTITNYARTQTLQRDMEHVINLLAGMDLDEGTSAYFRLLMNDYRERMEANKLMGLSFENNARANRSLIEYDKFNKEKFMILPIMMTTTPTDFDILTTELRALSADNNVDYTAMHDRIALIFSSTLLELFSSVEEDYVVGQRVFFEVPYEIDALTSGVQQVNVSIMATAVAIRNDEPVFQLILTIMATINGTVHMNTHSRTDLSEVDTFQIIHTYERVPVLDNQVGSSNADYNEGNVAGGITYNAIYEQSCIYSLIGSANVVHFNDRTDYILPSITEEVTDVIPARNLAGGNFLHFRSVGPDQIRIAEKDIPTEINFVTRVSFMDAPLTYNDQNGNFFRPSRDSILASQLLLKQHRHVMMNYLLRTQYSLYTEMGQQILEIGIEENRSLQQNMNAAVFSNTARIDDIIGTVVRYEAHELLVEKVRHAVFFNDLPFTTFEINTTVRSPIQMGGCFESRGSREFEGTIAGDTMAPITLRHTANSTNQKVRDADFIMNETDDVILLMRVRATVIDNNFLSAENVVNRVTSLNTNVQMYFRSSTNSGYTLSNSPNTGHRGGYIPMAVQQCTINFEIRELLVLDKKGVLPTAIEDAYLSGVVAGLENQTGINFTVTSATSGEIILDGQRYPCAIFGINRSVNTELRYEFGDDSFGVEVPQDGAFNGGHFSEAGQDPIIVSNGIAFQRTLPSSSFRYMREIDRWIGSGWPANRITIDFAISANDLSANLICYNRPRNSSWNDVLDTTWSEIFGSSNMARLYGQALQTILIQIDTLTLKWQVAVPPVNIGIRRVIDTSQEEIGLIVDAMLHDIEFMQHTISGLLDRLDYLESQVEQLLNPPGSSFLSMLLNALIDVAMGVALPGAGYILTKVSKSIVQSMAGPTKRVATTIFSNTTDRTRNSVAKHLTNSSKAPPVLSAARHSVSSVTTGNSKGLSITDFLIDGVEPIVQARNQPLLARLMPEVQMDLKTDLTRSRGNNRSYLYNYNANDEEPHGTFRTYYRPLETLGGLGRTIFKAINTENLRKKYARDKIVAGNKLPAHALASHHYTRINPNTRRIEEVNTIFGVGELSPNPVRSELNANIQGLTFIYEYDRTMNQKAFPRLLDHRQSGYSDEQLRVMYNTTHRNPIDTPIPVDNSEAWASIVGKTNKRVDKSTLVDDVHHTEPAMGDALRDLLENPPNVNYHLLNRNCQNVVNDFGNFLRGQPNDDVWTMNLRERLERSRNTIYLNDWDRLSSSETRIARSSMMSHRKRIVASPRNTSFKVSI
uniref:VP2 n=1 Tax=Heliothis armigera cypovirus 14 TaxID=327947 RepID=Q27Q81_9REOV|nr:unknown [Heliothis armigera cypovirus 14]